MSDADLLARLNAIVTAGGTGRVLRFTVHEYDQSIELFIDPAIPADWAPSEAMLKAVAALGYLTVYCDFKDDTEFVGAWRHRTDHGRKIPGGEYWVMSPRRERVGTPRW